MGRKKLKDTSIKPLYWTSNKHGESFLTEDPTGAVPAWLDSHVMYTDDPKKATGILGIDKNGGLCEIPYRAIWGWDNLEILV